MIIEIGKLTKTYGNKRALNNLELTIREGMFGLLGPNGAGKTTFMRILATLAGKSSGSVTIGGIPVKNKKEIRQIIGYLPQDFSMYPKFTVYEAMDYLAVLSGIKPKAKRKALVLELLYRVNLDTNLKTKVKALSGGMKRRLGIAQALINDPKVLITDEPTAGLDPEERVRFRNLLCDFARDRIVILSTHIVEDIEFTCENLAVLREGSLLYSGKLNDLIRQADGNIWTAAVSRDEFEELRNKAVVISSVPEGECIRVRLLSEDRPAAFAEEAGATLEDAYMKLMKGV